MTGKSEKGVMSDVLFRPLYTFYYPLFTIGRSLDSFFRVSRPLEFAALLFVGLICAFFCFTVSFRLYPLTHPRWRFLISALLMTLTLILCLYAESSSLLSRRTIPLSWLHLVFSLIWDSLLIAAIAISFYFFDWKGRFFTLLTTLGVVSLSSALFFHLGFSYAACCYYMAAIVGGLASIGASWEKKFWVLMSCLLCRDFVFLGLSVFWLIKSVLIFDGVYFVKLALSTLYIVAATLLHSKSVPRHDDKITQEYVPLLN